MREILFTFLVLGLTLGLIKGARAQTLVSTSQVISQPFIFTTATVYISGLQTTISMSAQKRGLAFEEQLKDEFPEFHEELSQGKVKAIAQVRQPAVREMLEEIASSEENLKEINAIDMKATELEKIALVLEGALFY